MATANVDVRSIDAALKRRPYALDGVSGRAELADVATRLVAYGNVPEALFAEKPVGAELVAADRGAGLDRSVNKSLHRAARPARHNASGQLAAALKHADHDGFVAHVARALAVDGTAHNRLVNLYNRARAANEVVAVHRAHILADHVAHAPSRFVRYAELALDFLSGNTIPARAELKHDKEPVTKRSAGAVEWRSGSRVHLPPAMLTRIGAATVDAVKLGFPIAPFAVVPIAKASPHQVLKAAFLGREAGLKLAKGRSLVCHAE